jgi:hypothetical protein
LSYSPALENADLLAWPLPGVPQWPVLLLGNGASQAVWSKYAYPSLLEVAEGLDAGEGLSVDSVSLFEALDTTNFEYVLSALATARTVANALERPTRSLNRTYRDVQRALGSAVAAVHLPWDKATANPLARIKAELRRHSHVFSTNYDLLVYWAIMHEGDTEPFKDFFWGSGGTFDINDVAVTEPAVRVFYLHGGLHLRRSTESGLTSKAVAAQGRLLRQVGWSGFEAHPLIVTEGSASDKLRTIARSDYLTFAHQELAQAPDGVVVVGHSLSPYDDHLVDVLVNRARAGKKRVAVSIRGRGTAAMTRKHALAARLPGCDLSFIKASTHPLLAAEMAVSAAEP